jgi:hypothetical protein
VFFPPLLLEITSALQWTIDLYIFAFLSNMVAELFVSHFGLIFVAAILGTPREDCLIQKFTQDSIDRNHLHPFLALRTAPIAFLKPLFDAFFAVIQIAL